MNKKAHQILTALLALFLISCSGNPFSESKMEKAYLKYLTTKGRPGGPESDPKLNAFLYDNVLEVKNFKIVKGLETSPNEHYIEVTFDTVLRKNTSDLLKEFPQDVLTKMIGDRNANAMLESWKKDFKAGATAGKDRSRAMVLKKFDSGWEVTEVGLPK